METIIKLQPEDYYNLEEVLIFYIGNTVAFNNNEVIEDVKNELLNADSIVVCDRIQKDNVQYYSILLPNYLLNVVRSGDNQNLQITSVRYGNTLKAKKRYIYDHNIFTILPRNGVGVILYQELICSDEDIDNNWRMDEDCLSDLINKMSEFFLQEKSVSEEKRNVVSKRFRNNILNYISEYTAYEDLIEKNSIMKMECIHYEQCKVNNSSTINKCYLFYSKSFNPDSEEFKIGSYVSVETTNQTSSENHEMLSGTIINRDVDVEFGTVFEISFKQQFNDVSIPKGYGRIFIKANETQKKVRERVLNAIERDNIESKYMYKTFEDYTTLGYEAQEGFNEFKADLEKEKYPPNKSQMQAIQRGIETKDIQLVLGPPGTGKTTVIVAWIKYYVSRGNRVLISSQNNSAVDNVLERVGKISDVKIIRLGNETKVQENCTRYLPEKQIKVMSEHFNNTFNLNKENFLYDVEQLKIFKEKITNILILYKEYYNSLEDLKISQIEISKILQKIMKEKEAIKDQEVQVNLLIEDRAQKNIYLYDTSRSNIFVRLWRYKYTKRVRSELAKSNDKLVELIKEYDNLVDIYNGMSQELISMCTNPKYLYQKNVLIEKKNACPIGALKVELKSSYRNNMPECLLDVGNVVSSINDLENYLFICDSTLNGLNKAQNALKTWENVLNEKRNDIMTNILIESSNVVGATCIGINTNRKFVDVKFDVSILDESGQIQVHDAIVPMTRAKKNLLLGDHLQIPPTVNEDMKNLCMHDDVSTKLLEMSFFEYLFKKIEERDKNTPNIVKLNEQFRMPGNISEIISEKFYENNYHARYNMDNWKPLISGVNTSLLVVSTSNEENRYEVKDKENQGYHNELEAEIVVDIIENLLKSGNLNAKTSSGRNLEPQDYIGVIAAYSKQVRYIRTCIAKRGLELHEDQIKAMVATLDSFQGQERPVIIYSSTRSTNYKSPQDPRVGFMKELRRLNVAFTRSQNQLVIIGDMDYLTTCEYEERDNKTGESIKNKSEKEYSEFMRLLVNKVKNGSGEYVDVKRLHQMLKEEK